MDLALGIEEELFGYSGSYRRGYFSFSQKKDIGLGNLGGWAGRTQSSDRDWKKTGPLTTNFVRSWGVYDRTMSKALVLPNPMTARNFAMPEKGGGSEGAGQGVRNRKKFVLTRSMSIGGRRIPSAQVS